MGEWLTNNWPGLLALLAVLGTGYKSWSANRDQGKRQDRSDQRQDRTNTITEQSGIIVDLRGEVAALHHDLRESAQAAIAREAACERRVNRLEAYAEMLAGLLRARGFTVPLMDFRGGRRGKRVLVADDQTDVKDGLAAFLQADGYDVVAVTDGQAAIDQLTRDRPDVLVLDLLLPVVSGEDVLRQVLGSEAGRKLPVFVLSAEPQRAARLTVTPNVKVLTKPFDIERLSGLIREALAVT